MNNATAQKPIIQTVEFYPLTGFYLVTNLGEKVKHISNDEALGMINKDESYEDVCGITVYPVH